MQDYIQLITGMVLEPKKTIEEAIAEKKLWPSIFTCVFALLFLAITNSMQSPFSVIFTFPISLVFSFSFLLLYSGTMHIIAELWGGQGKATDLLSAFALCHVPLFFNAPLVLLGLCEYKWVSFIIGIFNFAFCIWYFYLALQSLMVVEKLSMGKAIVLLFLPILFFVLLLSVIIFTLVAAGALFGLTSIFQSFMGIM